MIDKQSAFKLAKLYVDRKKFLSDRFGEKFEGHLLISDFLEPNPDPEVAEAFELYRSAKWILRRFLQEKDAVDGSIDDEVRLTLNSLVGENIYEASEEDFYSDERIKELEDKLLWQWWGPKEYVIAYLQARPLISVAQLPGRLKELVGEARRCHGFGQPNAVMALGRMILEFAITDIGERRGLFKADSLKDSYRTYPYERADMVLGESGPRRWTYRKLYDAGSKFIHSSDERPGSSYSALGYLREVVDFVAGEYAINKRAIDKQA